MATLREELEALELDQHMAGGRSVSQQLGDALSLCRRAVERAEEDGARAGKLAAMGEEATRTAEAEIVRLRAEVERLQGVITALEPVDPDGANMVDLLVEARETNQRLNHRCQQYEAGLAEKIAAGRSENRNLGRALANAAAERAEASEQRGRELLAEWHGEPRHACDCGGCRECRTRAYLRSRAASVPGQQAPAGAFLDDHQSPGRQWTGKSPAGEGESDG